MSLLPQPFDGHDAANNIPDLAGLRSFVAQHAWRIIQSTGAEVIHLGHDRSVQDVLS